MIKTPFLDGVPATAPTKLWTSLRPTLLPNAYRLAWIEIWLKPRISSFIMPSIPPSFENFVTNPEFFTSPPYPIAWSNLTTNRSNSWGFLLSIVVRISDWMDCFILSYELYKLSWGVGSFSPVVSDASSNVSLILDSFFGVRALTVVLIYSLICSSEHDSSIDNPLSLIL